MSAFKNPFDPTIRFKKGCSCGQHASQSEHDAQAASTPEPREEESALNRVIESTLVRSIFPHDETRRNFL